MSAKAKISWTKDQQDAIDSRRGTVLVSAAAGSGKTAVLVERVIQRLTDSEYPCSAQELLIVTFTKAATAQMRDRISAAILKRLSAEPSNAHLRRQYMLLPFAKICTIDSFCNDLVHENFHVLGISPDYSVLDNETQKIMMLDAAQRVLERAYKQGNEAFLSLSDLVSSGSSDDTLSQLIQKLHDISVSYPFPDVWLDSLTDEYAQQDIEKSEWGRIIKDYVSQLLDYCIEQSGLMLSKMESDEVISKAYGAAIAKDIEMYTAMKAALDEGWDCVLDMLSSVKFASFGRAPRGYESEEKTFVKTVRDKLKSLIKKVPGIMCATSAQHSQDVEILAEPAFCLVSLVKQFSEEYSNMKREMNAADFSDILHWALELLVERDGENIRRTQQAIELSDAYAEILVDEYQDINEAQDMIFKAISKNENNLFMVGDVKQSIYRFRQAMPEIFLRRRAAMKPYEGGNYPARINLDKNFRSRSEVTAAVNYIFRRIMSADAGEVDYGDTEALCAAASYPERSTPSAELHIVDCSQGDLGDLEAQAQYTAQYIENAVKSGMKITRGGELKPAGYGDFCILLRSAKNSAPVFAKALAARGIPEFSPNSGGFFEAAEISFVLSLLRVLDNPVQDIPLSAVMLSPVFGFSADELAAMRILDESETPQPLYRCVVAAAKGGDKKAGDFLKQLDFLRRLSLTLSAGELVRRVIDETGFAAIAGAMPGGSARRLNLGIIADYADKYEAAGNMGLSGFIRFIDKIARTDGDLETAAKPSEDSNVVRIMTVHQSKGLEFPVCILADMQHKFNEQDGNSAVVISSAAGIGLKRRAPDGISLYDTLSRRAASITVRRMTHSEELRVLYVALTRAKENLVMITSLKNPAAKLAELSGMAGSGEKITPFSVLNMQSFSDLVLSALISHPDAAVLRETAGTGADIYISKTDDFRLKTVIAPAPQAQEEEQEGRVSVNEPDAALSAEIAQRLNFVYPRAQLSSVPAKRAASESSRSGINTEFFASARPSFMNAGGLTPAQRGTATHKFMQFADYKSAAASPEQEKERLVDMGFLSETEGNAVNIRAVARFFKSDLAKRIFDSVNVMREKKFTCFVSAGELYPDLPESLKAEQTVIQGIADCAFEENGSLVIVDYKTDSNVTEQELKERYSSQLAVYRRALAACTGLPVSQTFLYSFSLNKSIEVLKTEQISGLM